MNKEEEIYEDSCGNSTSWKSL